MDIKDFILISGGLLMTLVIGHGCWIWWRAKREPLPIVILPNLVADDVGDLQRLRAELPNGGSRLANRRAQDMRQTSLPLDAPEAPLLMDVQDEPAAEPARDVALEPLFDDTSDDFSDEPDESVVAVRKPIHRAPPRYQGEPAKKTQMTVAEVAMPPVADPIVTEPKVAASKRKTQARERAPLFGRASRERTAPTDVTTESAPVEELLILNVLSPRGTAFNGESLVKAMRKQGLLYGDMNIFHRVEPGTRSKLFSVANAIEPGTFDLADIEELLSPGISFFLQLPGPDDAIAAFDMMLDAARNIALELGGELKDEQLSVLTGQTAQHMRQRIADFARKRLSKRA